MKTIKYLMPLCLMGFITIFGCKDKMGSPMREEVPAKLSYSVVDIELKMRKSTANTINGKIDDDHIYRRMFYAGPSAVPELAMALESREHEDQFLAGNVLHGLTSNAQWPEAYLFVLSRLRRLPSSSEAGELLYAVRHSGIAGYKEIAPFAAHYLNDETYVFHLISWSSKGKKEQDYRVCDIACFILQTVTGEDFGASQTLVPPVAVEKARAWARTHAGQFSISASRLPFVNGCNKFELAYPECAYQVKPAYSLVEIEMQMRESASNTIIDSKPEEYDFDRAYQRMFYAGPSVVPELAMALKSRDRDNQFLAGSVLHNLTSIAQWPEAYLFVLSRLRRLPSSSEAGELLYAVVHSGIAKYKEIAPFATYYLNDETDVFHSIPWSNKGKTEQDYRVCDFACFVLQTVTGEDFGASQSLVPPLAVEKARAWALAHAEQLAIPASK